MGASREGQQGALTFLFQALCCPPNCVLQAVLNLGHYRDELAAVESLQDLVDPARVRGGGSAAEVSTVQSSQVWIYVRGLEEASDPDQTHKRSVLAV
jgi:hypothetical protein